MKKNKLRELLKSRRATETPKEEVKKTTKKVKKSDK